MDSKKTNSDKEILIAISEIEKLRTKQIQFNLLNSNEVNHKINELIKKSKITSTIIAMPLFTYLVR